MLGQPAANCPAGAPAVTRALAYDVVHVTLWLDHTVPDPKRHQTTVQYIL